MHAISRMRRMTPIIIIHTLFFSIQGLSSLSDGFTVGMSIGSTGVGTGGVGSSGLGAGGPGVGGIGLSGYGSVTRGRGFLGARPT